MTKTVTPLVHTVCVTSKPLIGLLATRLTQLFCGTQLMTRRTLGQTSKPISLSGRLSRTAIKYSKYVILAFLLFLSGSVTKKLCTSKSEIHPNDIQNVIFNALQHTPTIQNLICQYCLFWELHQTQKILPLRKEVASESLLEVII